MREWTWGSCKLGLMICKGIGQQGQDKGGIKRLEVYVGKDWGWLYKENVQWSRGGVRSINVIERMIGIYHIGWFGAIIIGNK